MKFGRIIVICLLMLLLTGSHFVASAETFTIGINNFGMANFFARIGQAAMIEEIESLGGRALPTVTADVAERMAAIENYIAQGVDAIIIQEGDISQVEPALRDAKREGIFIASMGAGISEYADVVVESNEWVMGAMAATELVNRIDGQGNIILIYNDLGQMIRIRRKALETVLTEYPHADISDRFTYAWPDFFPDIRNKMEAVLQANPNPGDIAAVFATFDGAGVAAAAAIREAGLEDHIVIVGIDGDPQAYEEMRRPNSPFKATVAQDPDTMARTAVNMVFRILNGEQLPRRHFYIPAHLVTIEELPEEGDPIFD